MSINAFGTASGIVAVVAATITSQPAAANQPGLTFRNVPASAVVATIDRQYGSNILLGQGINRNVPLTMTVPGQADFDGRVSLVSYLAHALDADYRSVVTVRRVAAGHSVPPPQVNSNATVGFASQRMPVRTAIRVIASAQGAAVRLPNLSGTVRFSDRQLSVREAARELTQQTRTAWVLSYILVPRARALASAGRIIGYTPAGRPITEGSVVTRGQPSQAAARYMHRQATATQNPGVDAAPASPIVVPDGQYLYPYAVWPAPPAPYVTTANPLTVLGNGYGYGPTVTTPNGGVTVLPYYGGPEFYIGPTVTGN